MALRRAAILAVGIVVLGGGVSSSRWPGGAATPALAQGGQSQPEKGVSSKPLVTSLGPFKQAAAVPVVLTGQVVEIAPGGQTGRERFLVPSFLYVLQGTLTTDTSGGPIGVAGVQYHAAGQSYSEPPDLWHNFMNKGEKPVRYLVVFVGTPGGPTTEKTKPE